VASPRFVAVGDLMVDVLADGEAGHAATIRLRPGGTAANAAVWAAAAGAAVTVVGAVGDDAPGRMLRSELEARRIRPELSVDPKARTGSFLVLDGEIRADRGANARFAPADLPPELDADSVLVSGHLEPETVEAALTRARAPWIALDAGRVRDLPESASIVFLNETRAHDLTGAEGEEAARRLAEGRRLACVTSGAAGAVAVFEGERASAQPAAHFPGDQPGAGDAFAAAFLVALARGLDLQRALAEGCSAGSEAAKLRGDWPKVS
jgi:sugar/nucleoside kinase (ribokinase family)